MMTRKHFIAVAALIKGLADTTADPAQATDIAVRDVADGLADLFAKDNPNFDRARFLTACGF
jgi:hypothetical protein